MSNTNKLVTDLGTNHDMFIVPAYKSTNQITKGRGQGGLATLWKKGLTKYVSKISTNNFRIQATKFSFPSCHFVVINAYFPCDPRVCNFDETEVLTLLADIRQVVELSNCQNVLIAADMNADFTRKTKFTEIVEDGLNDLGLVIL